MWLFIYTKTSKYQRMYNWRREGGTLTTVDNSIPACKLMNRCLSELALQFKATKFVRIVADMCIPNYPDMNVPTLLVYGEGDIKANLVGAIQFGGMKMTAKSKWNHQWKENCD